jgi:DNA-binding FrmR family transcriptional regulator
MLNLMLGNHEKRELLKRLHYVKGQLAGIEKMIQAGRSSDEIYVQLQSVEAAFQKSILRTFETRHRLALAQTIVRELDSCSGPCQHCDDIAAIKKLLPQLTLKQVLEALQRLNRKERRNYA